MTATLDISKLRELHEKATRAKQAKPSWKHMVAANSTDAALIAYVRTHLPEILERLEKL